MFVLMNIRLLDRDGHTVRMTREEIAESLRKMGNPDGYYLLAYTPDRQNEKNIILKFHASTMPHYRFYQLWHKKFRWRLKQRALRKQFDSVNTKGLIWKPTPFVLEMPWLRLKGKRAITIEVK